MSAASKPKKRDLPVVTYEEAWVPNKDAVVVDENDSSVDDDNDDDGYGEEAIRGDTTEEFSKVIASKQPDLRVDKDAGEALRNRLRVVLKRVLLNAVYSAQQRAECAKKSAKEYPHLEEQASMCHGNFIESRDISMVTMADPMTRKLLYEECPARQDGVLFDPSIDHVAKLPRLPLPTVEESALAEVRSALEQVNKKKAMDQAKTKKSKK